MRHPQAILRTLIVLSALPVLAAPSDAPRADPAPIVRPYRSGPGQPRLRDAVAARTVQQPAQVQAGGTRRSRPYQPAKPGEGDPKG